MLEQFRHAGLMNSGPAGGRALSGVENQRAADALALHLFQIAGNPLLAGVAVQPPPIHPRLAESGGFHETCGQIIRLRGASAAGAVSATPRISEPLLQLPLSHRPRLRRHVSPVSPLMKLEPAREGLSENRSLPD